MSVSRIEIEEKYSNLWTRVTVLTLLLTPVLYFAYLSILDVLWRGIFRLLALISFSAAVFSGLKVMEGKHSMTLEIKDNHLVVNYFRNTRQVKEDLFEIDNIESVTTDQLPDDVFTNKFLTNDRTILLRFRDSDRELNLFELEGRILSVNNETAGRVAQFLNEHLGEEKKSGQISDR